MFPSNGSDVSPDSKSQRCAVHDERFGHCLPNGVKKWIRSNAWTKMLAEPARAVRCIDFAACKIVPVRSDSPDVH